MAATGHFLFEIIKIGILSAIYGTIVFLIVRTLKKNKAENGKEVWMRCFSAVYLLLFVFMFTYWGDHGLGDDSYLPIPQHKTVNESDESAFIGSSIAIGKFTYDNSHLFAEIADKRQIDGDYLIWDLQTNDLKPYPANAYLAMVKSQEATSPSMFRDFSFFYDKYWSGWRFWLLP